MPSPPVARASRSENTLSITEGIDLTGRTAVITGSTSGLGRECARVLALRGARVLLVARDVAKANATVRAFTTEASPAAASRCEVHACELASMASVFALANGIIETGAPVDLLFLNGGVFGREFELTADGLEATFAANYASHFLLVHRLVAAGALTPDARILASLSEGATVNPFGGPNLPVLAAPAENARRYSKRGASPSTKILLAMMAIEFTRRISATSLPRVTFNGVSPRATLTDNVNQGGRVLRALGRIAGRMFAPVEVGAVPLLWAATEPALAGQSGKVYSHRLAEIALPARHRDPQLAREAWDITERRLGLDAWLAEASAG